MPPFTLMNACPDWGGGSGKASRVLRNFQKNPGKRGEEIVASASYASIGEIGKCKPKQLVSGFILVRHIAKKVGANAIWLQIWENATTSLKKRSITAKQIIWDTCKPNVLQRLDWPLGSGRQSNERWVPRFFRWVSRRPPPDPSWWFAEALSPGPDSAGPSPPPLPGTPPEPCPPRKQSWD